MLASLVIFLVLPALAVVIFIRLNRKTSAEDEVVRLLKDEKGNWGSSPQTELVVNIPADLAKKICDIGLGTYTDPEDAPSDYRSVKALSRRVRVVYVDNSDNETEREITIDRITESKHAYWIDAYCHMRKGPRKFRSDRVQELTDLGTGEVFDDGAKFCGEFFDPPSEVTPRPDTRTDNQKKQDAISEQYVRQWEEEQRIYREEVAARKQARTEMKEARRVSSKLLTHIRPELAVLAYVAARDNRLENSELAAVRGYAEGRCPELLKTPELFDDYFKGLAGSELSFKRGCSDLVSASSLVKTGLIDACINLADIDAMTPEESAAVEALKMRLVKADAVAEAELADA